MNMFSQASKALYGSIKSVAGERVTYTRLAGGTVSLLAVRGSTQFQQQTDTPGETVFLHSIDFIVDVGDLFTSNTAFVPARGDTITALDDTVYTVLTDGSDAMFRYTDQSQKTMRVHCKRVS